MPKLPKIKPEIFARIRELAEKIYLGELNDITKGATHFHNKQVSPPWAQTKRVTAVIGEHIFYRK